MKLRIFKFALLAILLTAVAQFVIAAPLSEDELRSLLKFYAPVQALKVSFTQVKHLSDMNLDLKSEGRLEWHRPDAVKWEILKPSHLLVELSKSTVRLTEGEKSPQVFNLSELSKENSAGGLSLLMPWLLLDVKALSAQYSVSTSSKNHFTFTPKSDSKMFRQMEVTLGRSGQMEKLVLLETSGDRLEISFARPQVLK